MTEQWRWVKGYEGLYMVSDEGRVFALPKITRSNGVVMSQTVGRNGYCNVGLRNGKGKKRYSVHRLVADAFIDNTDSKPEVNHKDGNRTNNKASNLEWVTRSENRKHAIHRLGSPMPHGTPRFSKRKLTYEQVKYVRESDKPQRTLAKELGVNQTVISLIKRGITYKEEQCQ